MISTQFGVRTADLLASFQRRGWAAAYASASAPNEHTSALAAGGVATYACPPNREQALTEVLAESTPSAVVFDRFYAEEAFSFRVRQLAPHALRILDMQDCHALRACRQQLAESGGELGDVLAARPDATAPDCLRELAAIHRCDLTLVCSPVELELLAGHYGVPRSKLVLAPFFAPPSPYAPPMAAAAAAVAAAEGAAPAALAAPERAAPGAAQAAAAASAADRRSTAAAACPPFQDRRHFLMIGNWRHPPNLDSARWTCSHVWPALRAQLPAEEQQRAELHMYGAYPAGAAQQLHRPKEGIHMKGFAPSLDIMLSYRVLLAPLRYGAGLKGKVVDSWWHGLPVITTPIGAEGMTSADADADGGRAAAGAPVAAASAAAVDPAASGYVWQLGGDIDNESTGLSSAGAARAGEVAAQSEWGGLWGATTPAGLAASAALLYTDAHLWHRCQRRGFELLALLYDGERNLGRVHAAVEAAAAQLEERRRLDFTGGMVWSQQLRATEYFSRWIELKEAQREQQAEQQLRGKGGP